MNAVEIPEGNELDGLYFVRTLDGKQHPVYTNKHFGIAVIRLDDNKVLIQVRDKSMYMDLDGAKELKTAIESCIVPERLSERREGNVLKYTEDESIVMALSEDDGK